MAINKVLKLPVVDDDGDGRSDLGEALSSAIDDESDAAKAAEGRVTPASIKLRARAKMSAVDASRADAADEVRTHCL